MRPNPWVTIPSLVAALLAGILGYFVTDLSCRVETAPGVVESCPGSAAALAVVMFALVGVGMAVVLVLVFRSLAEHRKSG